MYLDLFKPTHLKLLCERYRLVPSKSYGQNYLIRSAPIDKIIAAADLRPDDTVIEIGPGFGALTLAVAPLVKRVIAFEIERKLVEYWQEKQREYPNVEIVWGDALNKLKIKNSKLKIKYKILANLPYQITSHALRTMLELTPQPERIVIMVQAEVADRICAKLGDLSTLAISVRYYGEPKFIAKVSQGNFWPAPRVDSALVAIMNLKPRADSKHFFAVVHAGFARKRKQLWNNLVVGLQLPAVKAKTITREVTGNEKIRAEELSVKEWEQLSALV